MITKRLPGNSLAAHTRPTHTRLPAELRSSARWAARVHPLTGPSFSTVELEDADYIDPLVYGDGPLPAGSQVGYGSSNLSLLCRVLYNTFKQTKSTRPDPLSTFDLLQ